MANGIEEFDENRQRAKIKGAFSNAPQCTYNAPPQLTFVRQVTSQEAANAGGKSTPSGSMGQPWNSRRSNGNY